MNLSTVKGFLGELMVKDKLEREGYKVVHRGNQSGYDIECDSARIDVKFSTLKNETGNHATQYWGWALKSKRKEKPITCTHFVCVAVNNEYEVLNYYVIESRHLKRFNGYVKRFKKVENGFIVLASQPGSWGDVEVRDFDKKCKQLISQDIAVKLSPRRRLDKVLFR